MNKTETYTVSIEVHKKDDKLIMCQFMQDFEVPYDATEEEIKDMARKTMLECIDWWYYAKNGD